MFAKLMTSSCIRPAADKIVIKTGQRNDLFVLADLPAQALPVFERLRAWRSERAKEQGVPAYVVFGDETLRNIAAQRPGSIAGLARIPGLGPGRLDRYGAAVLALCAATPPPRTGADEKKAGSRA